MSAPCQENNNSKNKKSFCASLISKTIEKCCHRSTSEHGKDDKQRSNLNLTMEDCISIDSSLRKYASNINESGNKPPLIEAIERGKIEAVKTMITSGANLTEADSNGNTPIHFAISSGEYNLAEFILEYLADFNISNKDGKTPLHLIAESNNVKLARKLLNQDADVESTDKRGRTPLMLACKGGYFPMVSLLLKYGSDPEIKDSNGWTASDFASMKGYTQIMNMLDQHIKSGLNVGGKKEYYRASVEEEEDIENLHQRKVLSLKRLQLKQTIPIKIQSDDMKKWKVSRQKWKYSEQKRREETTRSVCGIYDMEGNPTPVLEILEAMQLSAGELNGVHAWVLEQKQFAEEKRKQCKELKEHTIRLQQEIEALIKAKDNLKSKIIFLAKAVENAPSNKEVEALSNALTILKAGLLRLQEKHAETEKARDLIKKVFEEGKSLHNSAKITIEAKFTQLITDTTSFQEKLSEMQARVVDIANDLAKKCKLAEELTNHLKILLRGINKLVEDKNFQVNKLVDEVYTQEQLTNGAKGTFCVFNEEDLAMIRLLESLDLKMTTVRNHLHDIYNLMDNDNLKKSLTDAGVMEEFVQKTKELTPVPFDPYDPTGIMRTPVCSPMACYSTVEAVRFSWADISNEQQDDSSAARKDVFLPKAANYDISVKSSISSMKTDESSLHSEKEVTRTSANLQCRLAKVIDTYKQRERNLC